MLNGVVGGRPSRLQFWWNPSSQPDCRLFLRHLADPRIIYPHPTHLNPKLRGLDYLKSIFTSRELVVTTGSGPSTELDSSAVNQPGWLPTAGGGPCVWRCADTAVRPLRPTPPRIAPRAHSAKVSLTLSHAPHGLTGAGGTLHANPPRLVPILAPRSRSKQAGQQQQRHVQSNAPSKHCSQFRPCWTRLSFARLL